MDNKVIEDANQVVEAKIARLITDFENPRYLHGHYEGYGFQSESVCPNNSCKYYKYIEGPKWKPVCTHPNVIWSVEIGGVHKCPRGIVEKVAKGAINLIRIVLKDFK